MIIRASTIHAQQFSTLQSHDRIGGVMSVLRVSGPRAYGTGRPFIFTMCSSRRLELNCTFALAPLLPPCAPSEFGMMEHIRAGAI